MNGKYSYEYHPEVGVGQYYIYSDNWGFIASVRHEGIAEHIVTSVNSANTLQAENEALRQRVAELEAELKESQDMREMLSQTLSIVGGLKRNQKPRNYGLDDPA